jgi:hypothetical protein
VSSGWRLARRHVPASATQTSVVVHRVCGGAGRPVRRGNNLLLNVVIHYQDGTKVDHLRDLHREALPIDIQRGSDPMLFIQSPKRPTADEHESVADELFQKQTIMTAHSILKAIRFTGCNELGGIHNSVEHK